MESHTTRGCSHPSCQDTMKLSRQPTILLSHDGSNLIYRGYRDLFVPVVADSTQPRVPATEYYDEQAPADMEVVREIIRQLEQ